MKHWFLGLVLGLIAAVSHAHEVRPAYLELTADENGQVTSFWKMPVLDGRMLALAVRMPAQCSALGENPEISITPGARLETNVWDCGDAGLTEGRVVIEGLATTLIDVLVRVDAQDSDSRSWLVKPAEPWVDLAESEGNGPSVGAYLGLGVEHILLGIDHLAFVLGLLVLVQGTWALVKTITAFTVAHSITLGAATLGFADAPSSTIETLIALSILFLAIEIVARERGHEGWISRWPWAVAFGFGLLHGFGFAGALADVGLPEDAIPMSLFLFNVGVEIGQLLFVAFILALVWVLGRSDRLRTAGPVAAAWIIGVPAAYWTIDRLAGIAERLV